MNNSFLDETTPPSSGMTPEEQIYWEAVLSESRYTVQRILVPIVLIIGTFGNGITIAVLTRKHMQSSTNLYLTALAISDLLYLVFAFSLSLKHTPGITHEYYYTYWQYYRYALWIVDGSSNTSIWLTVAFTVERYVAVCHPMRRKVVCTQSRARKVVVTVYILCFLLTSTTPHEWIVVSKPLENDTHLMLDYSTLGSNEIYKTGFLWFTVFVFILLPLVLLATFNIFLVLAVKKSRKQRRIMTNSQKDRSSVQENKITVMLIAVVLLALMCQTPTAGMIIYSNIHTIRTNTIEFYVCTVLNNVFNLLIGINAAVNFIFYCALSYCYRKTFLKTFCRKWYAKRHPTSSWLATTGYTNAEDGSPRASFRSSRRDSSRLTSRQSSYRSSLSYTPKASPSQASIKVYERRNTTGGSFLKVPPRNPCSQPQLEAQAADVHTYESPEAITKSITQNGRSLKFTEEDHELMEYRCRPKTRNSTTSLCLEEEGALDLPPVPLQVTEKNKFDSVVKSFSEKSIFNRGTLLAPHRQTILIRYQKPSSEDQEQTNV